MNRTWNIVRWLCVIPVAIIAGWLGRHLGGLFGVLNAPYYPEFLFPLLFLMPSGFALITAGAVVAPRHRAGVAMALAVSCLTVSLTIHVVHQPRPGLVNYMHFAGEFIGTMLGIVWAWRNEDKRGRAGGSAIADGPEDKQRATEEPENAANARI